MDFFNTRSRGCLRSRGSTCLQDTNTIKRCIFYQWLQHTKQSHRPSVWLKYQHCRLPVKWLSSPKASNNFIINLQLWFSGCGWRSISISVFFILGLFVFCHHCLSTKYYLATTFCQSLLLFQYSTSHVQPTFFSVFRSEAHYISEGNYEVSVTRSNTLLELLSHSRFFAALVRPSQLPYCYRSSRSSHRTSPQQSVTSRCPRLDFLVIHSLAEYSLLPN